MPAFLKPPVDVIEEEDGYLVVVDLPGVKPEDIQLKGYDNYIEIEGVKKPPFAGNYLLMERFSGKFKRKVFFRDGVDTGSSRATLEDGVLTIFIPKSKTKVVLSTTTIIIRR
ncbi:MAG: Hsp20/alpha crystallin family protein [Aquificae bacterium]|nr:Hsp20/alpha crystallin family protein [Aquificota bacterium]